MSKTSPHAPAPEPTEKLHLALLEGLVRNRTLSKFQAEWLAVHWRSLPEDWASHPYFRDVREHTRLYIDLLRRTGS